MTIELTEAQRSELRQAIGRLDGTVSLSPVLTELYMRLEPGPEPAEQQYRDYVQHRAEQAKRMKEPCECRKTEPVTEEVENPIRPRLRSHWLRFQQCSTTADSAAWWFYQGRMVEAELNEAKA